MKKIILLTLILIAGSNLLQAQSSIGFNYNTTIRNNAAQLLVNEPVQFRFSIKKGSATASPIYTETHPISTDNQGQVNLVIGKGSFPTADFSQIDWARGSYFLSIELDRGSGFVSLGTNPLLSVPFAAYAFNSTSTATASLAEVLAKNNSANNLRVSNLAPASNAKDAINKKQIDDIAAQIELNNTKLQNLTTVLIK